jgi:hypothetical protein
MKIRIHLIILSVLFSLPLHAKDGLSTLPVSLTELAQKADAIMLAQVKDTDYFYRHEYPVSGSAYLKVLIPYKLDHPFDIIEIHEKGLHENECYFPNPTVFEEGRRYLLFLKKDPENPERFRGLAEGCALDVLVDENNQYALRYPVSGIELSDSLEELAREMTFSDPYAIENEESLTSTERNILLEAELIRPYVASSVEVEPDAFVVPGKNHEGKQWIYTKAIDLTTIRQLMDLDGANQ